MELYELPLITVICRIWHYSFGMEIGLKHESFLIAFCVVYVMTSHSMLLELEITYLVAFQRRFFPDSSLLGICYSIVFTF